MQPGVLRPARWGLAGLLLLEPRFLPGPFALVDRSVRSALPPAIVGIRVHQPPIGSVPNCYRQFVMEFTGFQSTWYPCIEYAAGISHQLKFLK